MESKVRYLWAALRISMGWIFLWGFLDKLFGLGLSTAADKSWLAGGSPTAGFLGFATAGPLSGLYQGLAGNPVVDWLFMLGLLGLGLALILGVGMRIAAYGGVLLMLLMWSARLPPATNPVVDSHIIYALLLIALAVVRAGDTLGLGRWWTRWVQTRMPRSLRAIL